jgi:hypothetical protein
MSDADTSQVPLGILPLDKLAAALVAFQKEMPTVAKNHTANTGTYSYTYADLRDVSEAAMPLLTKHGLSFVTLPGNGALTGMLLHESGQHITGSLPIGGGSPQQIGSALTYMRRYLLGCMTGIVTDDDDDGSLASRPRPAAVPESPPQDAKPATDEQTRQIAMLANDIGIDRDAKLAGVAQLVGRPVASTSELTEDEAENVVSSMRQRLAMQKAETGE